METLIQPFLWELSLKSGELVSEANHLAELTAVGVALAGRTKTVRVALGMLSIR